MKPTVFHQSLKRLSTFSAHTVQQPRTVLQHLIASGDELAPLVDIPTVRAPPSIDSTSDLEAFQARPVRRVLELEVIFIPAFEDVALDLPDHVAHVPGARMAVGEGRRQTAGERVSDDVEDGLGVEGRAGFVEDGLACSQQL